VKEYRSVGLYYGIYDQIGLEECNGVKKEVARTFLENYSKDRELLKIIGLTE